MGNFGGGAVGGGAWHSGQGWQGVGRGAQLCEALAARIVGSHLPSHAPASRCREEDAAIYQASAQNAKGIVSCSGVLEVGTMTEYKIDQLLVDNMNLQY